MSTTDELLRNAEAYAASFDKGDLPLPPARKIAVLACMDARLNPYGILGLQEGDAHIIRNAGGIATDDVIRSVIVSQQLLGTDEVVVIGHTQCGLLGADEGALRQRLAETTGTTLDLAFGSFGDLEATVRWSLDRLRAHPWVRSDGVQGLVFEVETGRLHEVR